MKALGLKTVNADMTSHGGFKWPESGLVEAPDWNSIAECGGGLHLLPWGEGDGSLLDWDTNTKWIVAEYDSEVAIDLQGKIKVQRCEVVFVGDRGCACNYILANGGQGKAIVGSTVSGGDRSTVSGGDRSTVSGGYGSTVSGGYGSTVSGGDWSTVSGGYGSTVSGGYGSTVSGGYGSTVSGGDRSTVSGGDGSTVSGGYGSTVSGKPTAKHVIAVAGVDGSAQCDESGLIAIRWWDSKAERCRLAVGYVGENGIKQNTPYIVRDGKLVKKESAP